MIALFSPQALKASESRKVREIVEYHFGPFQSDPLVEKVGRTLLAQTSLQARFLVVDAPMVNALTLPDGDILIFRGMLGRVREHPDWLAGVLAHELGHLEKEHFLRKVYWLALLQFCVGFLIRPLVLFFARQVIHKILVYGFGRVHELEADDAAFDLMVRSGFSPNGLAELFDDLEKVEEPGGLLGIHPEARVRASRVRKRMRKLGIATPEDSKRKVLTFPRQDTVDKGH